MSIAQEIQRLQMAKAAIKTAIEAKGVTVGDSTIDTYAAKISEISVGSGSGSGDYEQGFEDGKNSVVDVVPYLKQGQFTSLNIFKEPIVTLNLNSWNSSLLNLFQITAIENKNTTVERLTINMPNNLPKSIQQMFYSGTIANDDKTLKHIIFNVDTSVCTTFANAFGGMQALEIIDGTPFDFSANTNAISMFNRCYTLKEFRVVANTINKNFTIQHSNLLSTDTIQSIIDGLATVSTAQTLTLHKDVKILQSQVDSANAKGWTVAGGIVVSEEEYYG
jgi:hypothetical protein